jgi:hypothetical protein
MEDTGQPPCAHGTPGCTSDLLSHPAKDNRPATSRNYCTLFFGNRNFFVLQRRAVQGSAGVQDGNRTLFKKALTPGQRKKLYAIANTVVPEKILEVLFEFHLILFK